MNNPFQSEGDSPVADQPASDPASQRSRLRLADIGPGVSCGEAALAFYAAGFAVIPGHPDKKHSAVRWDWLDSSSPEKIAAHHALHPDHTVCCILDERLLVLDADTPLAIAHVHDLERKHGVESNFVVNTRRGRHSYYRLLEGVFARTNSHSTEAHPERIDVKAARSLVIMPPSPNKTVARCDIEAIEDLTPVGQDFVNAVFRHNGCEPPRKHVVPEPRDRSADRPLTTETLRQLAVMLERIDPDCGYGDWFSVLAAVHHETGGSEDGFALVDAWSSRGNKYCGEPDLRVKWRSLDGYTGTPITGATIHHMLAAQGDDWIEICASAEQQFEPSGYQIIESSSNPRQETTVGKAVASILARYSITLDLENLSRRKLSSSTSWKTSP